MTYIILISMTQEILLNQEECTEVKNEKSAPKIPDIVYSMLIATIVFIVVLFFTNNSIESTTVGGLVFGMAQGRAYVNKKE